MKFAITVVMLALALGAQSSVLPWGHLGVGPLGLGPLGLGHGLSVQSVHGPALLPALGHGPLLSSHSSVIAHGAPLLGHGGPILAHGAPLLGHGGPILAHGGPIITHAPAAVDLHAPHLGGSVAHQAGLVPGSTYVAKTRGAVHTAPLAGHLNSAASLNLLPAPGTI